MEEIRPIVRGGCVEKKSVRKTLARAEVDDEIEKKHGVGDTVEYDPASAEIVVEEGNGDRQNYEIDKQRQRHEEVPVKSTHVYTQTHNEYSVLSWCIHTQ